MTTFTLSSHHYDFPRDLLGYGPLPPTAPWPNNAYIALSFVINYEEGGENCVLYGDSTSEASLWESSGRYPPRQQARAVNVESDYEYGSRVGVWRIMSLFERMGFKWTLYAVGMAAEKNPEVVRRTMAGGSEVASHAYRWVNYEDWAPEREKEMVRKGVESLSALMKRYEGDSGKTAPVGWYYGRLSSQSRALVWDVFDELGLPLLWQSDAYSDDLPYWIDVPREQDMIKKGERKKEEAKGMLMLPYSYDCNDFKFHTPTGFSGPGDFFDYLKNALDVLYEEGKDGGKPKMMTVGLHCRIVGKPGRFAELKRFCEYVSQKQGVWIATREEIAKCWMEKRPYKVGEI
jgi:peptidoglycan/xylan/chitin deacetylase (PgdA/CDA1 family)